MEIEIKEVKRDGKYSVDTDEQPEITIEVSGKLVVYGDEAKEKFTQAVDSIMNEYAI